MATYHRATAGTTLVGRLAHDGDLLGELTAVAREQDLRLGAVSAIGAVRQARLGFYDQAKRVYDYFVLDRPLEITALVGNVSLKDGAPVIHAHVTLSDETGRAYGGHLAEGCVVFACEFTMTALASDATFARGLDEPTGLPLWSL
ncbi:MAG: PPC domain-containing DNA-binding protein [Planctomycetota bacterium]